MGVSIHRISWKKRGRLLLLLIAGCLLSAGYLFTIFRLDGLVTLHVRDNLAGIGGLNGEEEFGGEKAIEMACETLVGLNDEVWEEAVKEVVDGGFLPLGENPLEPYYNNHHQRDIYNDKEGVRAKLRNKERFLNDKDNKEEDSVLIPSMHHAEESQRKSSLRQDLNYKLYKQIVKRVCANRMNKSEHFKKANKDFVKDKIVWNNFPNEEGREKGGEKVRKREGSHTEATNEIIEKVGGGLGGKKEKKEKEEKEEEEKKEEEEEEEKEEDSLLETENLKLLKQIFASHNSLRFNFLSPISTH